MADRRQFNVSIDSKTLDEIIETITDVEINNLEEIIKEDAVGLKKLSALFLKKASEAIEKVRMAEAMMLTQKNLRAAIRNKLNAQGQWLSKYETDEYRENRNRLKDFLNSQEIENLYEAAFSYHEQLNEFLKQKVKTIIVVNDENGDPILYDIEKNELFDNNFLSFEETSKTARLTARFRITAEKLRQAGIAAINRDDLNLDDPDFNINNLNLVYKIVLFRFDTYNKMVIWEYPKDEWNKMLVTARGDITEAYASFFLRKTIYKFNNGLNQNIDDFMIQGVKEVDNVSGLLQGDVEAGLLQYAIKSADASYMSIIQMISLAKKIVTDKKGFTLEKLRKEKDRLAKKKAKERQKFGKALANEINDTLLKTISEEKTFLNY